MNTKMNPKGQCLNSGAVVTINRLRIENHFAQPMVPEKGSTVARRSSSTAYEIVFHHT